MTDPLLTERGPGYLGRLIVVSLLFIPGLIIDRLNGLSFRQSCYGIGPFVRGGY